MKPLNLPRVGRYRLYDLLPKNLIRCRLCPSRRPPLKRDNAWRHWETEIARVVVEWDDGWMERAEALLEERLHIVLLRRRSRRHRAHGQYEYATGGNKAGWKP